MKNLNSVHMNDRQENWALFLKDTPFEEHFNCRQGSFPKMSIFLDTFHVL
jgi:hypothetical protein